jgi:hypothetical protein
VPLTERGRDRDGPVGVRVGDADARTGAGERPRDRLTDPAGTTGDDRDLAVERPLRGHRGHRNHTIAW